MFIFIVYFKQRKNKSHKRDFESGCEEKFVMASKCSVKPDSDLWGNSHSKIVRIMRLLSFVIIIAT